MYCSQPRVRGRKRSQTEQTRLSTSPCVKALLHFLHSHPYSSPGQEQQQGTKSTQQLQSIASAVPAAALEIYRNQREQGGVFKADTGQTAARQRGTRQDQADIAMAASLLQKVGFIMT